MRLLSIFSLIYIKTLGFQSSNVFYPKSLFHFEVKQLASRRLPSQTLRLQIYTTRYELRRLPFFFLLYLKDLIYYTRIILLWAVCLSVRLHRRRGEKIGLFDYVRLSVRDLLSGANGQTDRLIVRLTDLFFAHRFWAKILMLKVKVIL